MFLNIRNFTI